jgi:hypothetical protein
VQELQSVLWGSLSLELRTIAPLTPFVYHLSGASSTNFHVLLHCTLSLTVG